MKQLHRGRFDGLLGPAALIGASVIWGFFPVATRAVEDSVTAPQMLLAQSLFATVALVPYIVIVRPPMPTRRYLPRAIFLGLLGTFFTGVPIIYGIHHVEAGTASLLSSMSPVVAMVCAAIFLAERFTRRLTIGVGLALAGSVAVAAIGDAGFGVAGPELWGSALVLLSAVIWGSYSVAAKPWLGRIPAASLPVIGRLASLPLAALIGSSGFIGAMRGLDWKGWLAIMAFSVGAGVIANVLFALGLERRSATEAALYSYLTPLFGVIGGIVFLSESLYPIQIAGGALILVGVGVATVWPRSRHDATGAEPRSLGELRLSDEH